MKLIFICYVLFINVSFVLASQDIEVYTHAYEGGGFDLDKEIFVSDIVRALESVFKVKVLSLYVDKPKDKSYLDYYKDNDVCVISYHEYKNGGFRLNRSFYCGVGYYNYGENVWCREQIYYVDGKEVKFNEDLKGKDPVYDWVIKNMPKERGFISIKKGVD